MALTVPIGPLGNFDPYTRDQLALFNRGRLALGLESGTAAQEATARAELWGRPDFTARANTTDNSAASQVIDLTDEGVTFGSQKFRRIRFSSRARSDNDQWFQTWEQLVWGDDGTTPKLVGDARLIHAGGVIAGAEVAYGNCHVQATYSGDTATAVAANSSAGSSLGNNSTNTITLTHPISRASPKWVSGINASADVATATEALHVGAITATTTTFSIFCADLATPGADGFDDDGTLDVDFYILPPPSIALAMNSNNVEVHVGHDATDVLDHDIEVFVGRQEDWAVSPT